MDKVKGGVNLMYRRQIRINEFLLDFLWCEVNVSWFGWVWTRLDMDYINGYGLGWVLIKFLVSSGWFDSCFDVFIKKKKRACLPEEAAWNGIGRSLFALFFNKWFVHFSIIKIILELFL